MTEETIYTPEQVAVIDNADARAVLITGGLPNTDAVSFRAAASVTLWERDPNYAVIGWWDIDEIPVVVDRVKGTVFTAPPWSDEIDPINASVRTFAESLAAVDRAKPLTMKRYGTSANAATHVRATLHAIDAETLENPFSFWQNVVDDIKLGVYNE